MTLVDMKGQLEVGLGAAVVVALSTISFIIIIFLYRTRRVKAIGQIRRIEGANSDNGYPYLVVFSSGRQTDIERKSVVKLTLRGTKSDSSCFIFKSLDDRLVMKPGQWNTFLIHTLSNLGDVMAAEIEFDCPNTSTWFLKYLLVINITERRQWYLEHHRCLQVSNANPVIVHLAAHKNRTFRLFQDNISRCMTRFHIWLNPFYEHTGDELKDLLKGLILGFLLGGLLFSSLLVYDKLTSQDTKVTWEVTVIAVVAHMLVGIIAQTCFLLTRRINETQNIKSYKRDRYKSEKAKYRKIPSREETDDTKNQTNNEYETSDHVDPISDHVDPISELQTIWTSVWSSLRPNKAKQTASQTEDIKSETITDEEQSEIESFSRDIVKQCTANVREIFRDKPQTSLVGFLLQMSNSNRNLSPYPDKKIMNRRLSEEFSTKTSRRSPQATSSDSDLRTHNRESDRYHNDRLLRKYLSVQTSYESQDSGIGSLEDIEQSLKLASSPNKFSTSIIEASFLAGLNLMRLTALRGFERFNDSRQSGFKQLLMYLKIPWIETENPNSYKESIDEIVNKSSELLQISLPDCLNQANIKELDDMGRFCFLGIFNKYLIQKTKAAARDLTLMNCKDFSSHMVSTLFDIKQEIKSFHDQGIMDRIFDYVNRMLKKEVVLNSSLTDDLCRVGLAGQYLTTVITHVTLRTQVALAISRNFCHAKIHLSENKHIFAKHFDKSLANRFHNAPNEMLLNKICPLFTDLCGGYCTEDAKVLEPQYILTRIVSEIHKLLVGREIRENVSTQKHRCCKLCQNSRATRKLVEGMLETAAGYHLVLRVLTAAELSTQEQCRQMHAETSYIYPKLLSDMGRVLLSSEVTVDGHLEILKSVTASFTKDMVLLATSMVAEELTTVLMLDTTTVRYVPQRLQQFLKYLQIELDACNKYSNVTHGGANMNNNARIKQDDLKMLREEFQEMKSILTNLIKEDAKDSAILQSSYSTDVQKTSFCNWIKTMLYKCSRIVADSISTLFTSRKPGNSEKLKEDKEGIIKNLVDNRIQKQVPETGEDIKVTIPNARDNRIHGEVGFDTDESNDSNSLEGDSGVTNERDWNILEIVPDKWDIALLRELLEDVRLKRNLSRRVGYGLVIFLCLGCISFAFGIVVLSAQISAPPTAPWLLTAILAVFLHILIIEPIKAVVIAYFYAYRCKALA